MKAVVSNHQRAVRVDARALREAALWVLRRESGPPAGEISIAVVDDAAIRALNRRYRRTDRATDVLAFPQDSANQFQQSGANLLGDVVVSAERAVAQAPRYGHTVQRELRLLVIHGVLHLLGYADETAAAARRMRRRQDLLLRTLEDRRTRLLEDRRTCLLEDRRTRLLEDGRTRLLEDGRTRLLEDRRTRLLEKGRREKR